MSETPFLFFSQPADGKRIKQKPRKIPAETATFNFPSVERQEEILGPKFKQLESVFEGERAELLTTPVGLLPEQAIVLETVGKVSDFISAVRTIEGMEWLGEVEQFDIPADNDFFATDMNGNRKDDKTALGGRLFLTMVNQRALREVLSLWERYKTSPQDELGPNRSRWRNLFQQLRDVRPWGLQERFMETGIIEAWDEEVDKDAEIVRFEVELWFRRDEAARNAADAAFTSLLHEEGGRVISRCMLPAIEYHGLLAELPSDVIVRLIQHPDVKLLHSSQVMFFRPAGQAFVVTPLHEEETEYIHPLTSPPIVDGNVPVVALLDGLPLENHFALAGRLFVDDPDGWSAAYPALQRKHGTAMASLIVNGELDSNAPSLSRPLYVRPIMRPDPDRESVEFIPDDVLPIDIVHRAVRRLFESESDEPPVAPHVRIINLSIGDRSRPYDNMLSAWARLLDWLSWKYKVLFIVSAGNHPNDIDLDVPSMNLHTLSTAEVEKAVVTAIAKDAVNRRLLSPSESMNALTVGASHADGAVIGQLGFRRDLLASLGLPSPINALGLGHNRSIKPDILVPGGRQLFMEKIGHSSPSSVWRIAHGVSHPPGMKVASPGSIPGVINATSYLCGTSNATALASRYAANVYEGLLALTNSIGQDMIHRDNIAMIIKALLVHAASWGKSYDTLESILKPTARGSFKEYATRFLGYGMVDYQRLLSCTEHRATIIGAHEISNDGAQVYQIPLPPSLSAKTDWRRLTITLAWFTPTDASSRGYRKAALSFSPPKEHLMVGRVLTADHNAVKRGTIQHESFEGKKASAYTDGTMLQVRVECKVTGDDPKSPVKIPYALIVTLETKEDSQIPVYQEIKSRLQVLVAPRVR